MVFAFEPDPDNFALLKNNTELTELNSHQNVLLENKTVSDRTQKMRTILIPQRTRQTTKFTIQGIVATFTENKKVGDAIRVVSLSANTIRNRTKGLS